MKIKLFVLLCISFIISTVSLTFSSITYAQSISLYDQPNNNAKPIGTADLSTGIIPIYTPANGGDWIKVADPRNGNVGWVKSSDLKNAKGGENSITFTQKIISNGNQPNTYQAIQFGNTNNLTAAQMQEFAQKMRAEQQAIQNSFQGILKDMNALFQREWNLWSTQGSFPVIISAPKNTQPNQATPNNQTTPQPETGNAPVTKPNK